MEIRDIMSSPAVTCTTTDKLDVAAQAMWDHDIGTVCVVDDTGRLAGVLTDRDICMATYTKGLPPHAITAADVMSRDLHALHEKDTLEVAEQMMSVHRVRRLPIIDDGFHVVGLVSVNDLARAVAQRSTRPPVQREFIDTLAAICEPRAEGAPPFALPPDDPRRAVL